MKNLLSMPIAAISIAVVALLILAIGWFMVNREPARPAAKATAALGGMTVGGKQETGRPPMQRGGDVN